MAGSPDVLAGTFAGRYTIERELGSGATATVYLARDTQRGMFVAVKLLRHELSQSVGAERFLREIRLNEKLHHPHIVPVLDSGEHEGRLYFVLPHMEGGSLRQLLQREKQLPIERAIEIAKTIAQALDYAHQQKLIHRDVKPENILFTAGQACLADFGIARAVERAIDESTTETGLVRGTPAYMSPEQASGSRHYDGRSDQYSLACVLYEMLAGVPAFIGPTPEAVIAMRFKHAPRPLSVFRPTVSEPLEELIARALAVAPADRYATAADFAQALEQVPRTPTRERSVEERGGATWRKRSVPVAIGLVGTVTALSIGLGLSGQIFPDRLTASDSLRYALLPIEGDSSAVVSEVYDRLHQSLAQWSGIELLSRFDVREAIGSESPVTTDDAATEVAKRLRAGRYVRARLARAGSGFSLTAVLTDAVGRRQLIEVTSSLAGLPAENAAAFDRVAATLLLQTSDSASHLSRTLPAAQLFLQGMAAQRAFQLERADSLLGEAVERDRSFASAALWLAQVRAWRLEAAGVDNWLPWAERAMASSALAPRQRQLAHALVALGRRRYDEACGVYRAIIAESSRSFEGWYGLGQCLDWDRAVIPDSRSPSGWRFRSSYHRAIQAYVRAFELAPLMHRNFEPHAFSRLRRMLYAGRALGRSGLALPPDTTAHFVGYPEWRGDSLVFHPYPVAVVRGGGVRPDRQARARATEHQQLLFGRIARTWSAAFPRNASAKEAVALALEMAGDASALDTMRLARQLTDDHTQRMRLATEEVLLRVSLSRRNPAVLADAATLADSLLAGTNTTSLEQAQLLGPLAVLRGRCALSAQLAARTASRQFPDFPNIPRSSIAAADSLGILLAMGCEPLRNRSIDDIVRTAAASGRVDGASIPQLEYWLFARAYLFAPPRDSAWLRRLASSGGALLKAMYDMARTDTAAVSAMLTGRLRQRGPSGSADVTPDAVYPEVVLWLSLGDSAVARTWADPMLERASWLELLLDDSFAAAAIMRIAVLRFQLAHAAADRDAEDQWRAFVQQLWGNTDPELKLMVQQMGR
jgi:serine/threonine protein kinase